MPLDHPAPRRGSAALGAGVLLALIALGVGVRSRPAALRVTRAEPRPAPATTVAVAAPASPSTTIRPGATPPAPVTTLPPVAQPPPRGTSSPTTTARFVAPGPTVPRPAIALAADSGRAGETVTVQGSGCSVPGPGRRVSVRLLPRYGDITLAEVVGPVPADGRWSVTLPVPARVLPGQYQVFAHCGTEGAGFDYPTRLFVVELPAV